MNIKFQLNSLLHLFYPTICYACNCNQRDDDEMICMECFSNLPYTGFETIPENATEKLFWGRIPISFACSIFYFEKDNMIQHVVHHIKYNNEKNLGTYMGKLMGVKIKPLLKAHEIDYIIAMPLHPKKEKKRGYNQAALLCNGIKEICQVNYHENAILRIQHTQTQTKKSRIERWQNVSDVFDIPNPNAIKGKNILIIDDVITTGASTEACGQTLLHHGAKSISICGLAHTSN